MSKEVSLGISAFLNPQNPGFNGVIKERFSDFNVHEISLSGEVVELGTKDAPVEHQETEGLGYSSLTDEQKLLFSETQFLKAKILDSPGSQGDILELDVTTHNKDQRKMVHQVIKMFPRLDSNTVDREGAKLIVASLKSQGKKEKWPRDRPKFLHFSLFKENCDTSEAVFLLSGKVRTPAKHFGYAGTKDKRGRTLQRVSVSLTSAQQIRGAANIIRGIEVGNFSYEKEEIKLGQLKGNRFELAVRNITAEESVVDSAIRFFSQNGFINYFGTQRFGTTGVPTHHVGKALVGGHYEEAINLILHPRDFEKNWCLKEARNVWGDTGDAEKALDILSRGRKDQTIEGKLLLGLCRSHKNDKVGALEYIPRPQRSMYCHAFQSFLWNKVVSRRVETHGLKVLEGDLVYKRGVDKPKNGEEKHKADDKEEAVEVVTNIEGYTIYDVLIPIPGSKVKFPENEVRTWFEEVLAEEGFQMDCFDDLVKSYNLPGDYRPLLVKAEDIYWKHVTYTDPVVDLIPSPAGKKDGGKSEEKVEEDEITDTAKSVKGKEPEETSCPEYRALIFKFSLPSSSYATMALREVMRVETDQASMKAQNNYKEATDLSENHRKRSTAGDEVESPSKVPKIDSSMV